ncbi:helix-turn-helix domain-containing protein [Clostridium neuense]|uniref:Helix-turn-helix domain-containing protein n=1 Tax=Clostridium neuense TaxID=1728934 RepID=A0ABW8TCP6_9CLOT
MTFSDDEVLTVKEVASFLKICRVNAYNLFNEKNFPCIYIGKSKRVQKSDLINYINNNLKNNN